MQMRQMQPARGQVSRRGLLKGAAGLVVGVYLAPSLMKRALATEAAAADVTMPAGGFAPNAFIRVATDDTVTVLVKHIEFGQGPFTGLATLVAEEMDADWAQMRAEHAPADTALYTNSLFGMQGTGGSTAIANSFMQMRQAGAAARAMLVAAAAADWQVEPAALTVSKGRIRHAASGRETGFGAVAEAAAKLPVPTDAPVKSAKDFKLIGHDRDTVGRLDSRAKTNGSAMFTADIHTDGMVVAVVAHPPRFGGRVKAFDASQALAVRGVLAVREVPTGVAVYAESTWPAIKARELLDITWDDSAAEMRGTEQILADFSALAKGPGAVAATHGDAQAVLAAADQVVEAEFQFPYLAHAPMEPLDGWMTWDGSTAYARFGSQIQTSDQMAIAAVFDVTPDKVRIDTMLAGGSFGRRGQVGSVFAVELAAVTKTLAGVDGFAGRPVKLVWTREDDIQGGYYRPMFVHRMRGAVKDGAITAWADTVVGQSFIVGTPWEGFGYKDGVDALMVEGASELRYTLPAFSCDLHIAKTGVPVLFWRSVGHTHTGYAVECFVDELLAAAGQDPVDGRLALMAEAPREAGVLRAVAELARWHDTTPPEGRARGVAVVKSFGTHVAEIVEVSVSDDGEPRVHKVWCAVDCGVAVNPDVIRAQIEGGIGYGIGHALYGEITMEDGLRMQSNFDGYRSLRINEMPEVEVVIVASDAAPSGIGEPGLPPVAPAIANAMARLGRERPRRLPMLRETA
ncbi:xanthine dehydrogenase family protein molybdopterin-binding subunit [Tistrella sp. BH-R2-4]|uniref:Xanthine dehydrogenase family protein molybdopterin-binding subunit n=1 Tax=Tistrella arctica TaxID=3133430 RepID=A0ABU9YSL7_9PROT